MHGKANIRYEIYLLIKYIKSVLWRAAKRLSYIQDARCLKINIITNIFLESGTVLPYFSSGVVFIWWLLATVIGILLELSCGNRDLVWSLLFIWLWVMAFGFSKRNEFKVNLIILQRFGVSFSDLRQISFDAYSLCSQITVVTIVRL
jgi:hypothetical protein